MAEEHNSPARPARKIESGDDPTNALPSHRSQREGETEVGGRGVTRRELVICPNCSATLYIERLDTDELPLYRCAYCSGFFKPPQ